MELICNPADIADTLAARYDKASSTEIYLSLFTRNAEVESDLSTIRM